MSLNQIHKAHNRIKSYIHRTPIFTNNSLNELSSARLYFKCENFQKAGSFKIRGATNAVLQLSSEKIKCGVATASSGNHGAALSMAVSNRGGITKVVMPNNTPEIKVNNVIRNGGEIIWCEPNFNSRETVLKNLLQDSGAELVHPYNDMRIVIGQATIAKELLEDVPNLDIIISPVSGGGLLSGILNYVKKIKPDILVFGAEPIKANDAYRSLQSGKIEINKSTNTICDGLRAQIGTITFPIIKDLVDGIFTLSEKDIVKSMKLIFDRMKIIVEPSCSIALAAVLKNKTKFIGKKIGIILSGGNIDLNKLPWYK